MTQSFRSQEYNSECESPDLEKRRLSLRAPQIRGPLIRMPKTESMVDCSQKTLLMKTCSVFLKDNDSIEKCQKKKKRKVKCTYSVNSGSPKKNAKSLNKKRISKLTKDMKPPVIIIEDLDKAEEEKGDTKKGLDTFANLLRRDSLKTIALKAKEKQQGGKSKSKGKDMSHIKAKWLLGLSLTMVKN